MFIAAMDLVRGGTPGDLVARMNVVDADFALFNDMPCGPLFAAQQTFDVAAAQASVRLHEDMLTTLAISHCGGTLATRSRLDRHWLVNEAVLVQAGQVRRRTAITLAAPTSSSPQGASCRA